MGFYSMQFSRKRRKKPAVGAGWVLFQFSSLIHLIRRCGRQDFLAAFAINQQIGL